MLHFEDCKTVLCKTLNLEVGKKEWGKMLHLEVSKSSVRPNTSSQSWPKHAKSKAPSQSWPNPWFSENFDVRWVKIGPKIFIVVTMMLWRHGVLNRFFKNWAKNRKTQNYEKDKKGFIPKYREIKHWSWHWGPLQHHCFCSPGVR